MGAQRLQTLPCVDHAVGDGPVPTFHVDGDDLSVVVGFDLPPDFPLVYILAEAGRLFTGPALARRCLRVRHSRSFRWGSTTRYILLRRAVSDNKKGILDTGCNVNRRVSTAFWDSSPYLSIRTGELDSRVHGNDGWWELGVAGVEGPSESQLGGLGFRQLLLNSLNSGGTPGMWERTQVVGDRREAGLRAQRTGGFRFHGAMFRGVRRLRSVTGISVRASFVCVLLFRATASAALAAV